MNCHQCPKNCQSKQPNWWQRWTKKRDLKQRQAVGGNIALAWRLGSPTFVQLCVSVG